jgi:hypothetical protein
LLRQVHVTVKYFPAVSEVEEDPENGNSTGNVKSLVEVPEDSEASKEEDNNPFNPEALLPNIIKSLTMN